MAFCNLCFAREVEPGYSHYYTDWCPRCIDAYHDGWLDDWLKEKADRITEDKNRFDINVKLAVKISRDYGYDEHNEKFWNQQHPGVVSLIVKIALQKAKTKSHDECMEDIKKTIRDEEIKSGRRITFRPSWILTKEQAAAFKTHNK